MERPLKPVLLWDGDCSFCRQWVARWQRAFGDRVETAPWQQAAARFPEIPLERFRRAVQLLEPDGRLSEGAEAVFRALARAPRGGWALGLYLHLPGFAAVSEWCYRRVARHRNGLARVTGWVWGPHLVPPGETLTAWIFLRLLALVYAVAFVSLGVQIVGLVGSHGILPARDFLEAVGARYGPAGHWLVPSLCWLDASDHALVGLCMAGTALAALLAAGLAPVPCLIGLWALYLSLVSVGQDFLGFQWDSLLLEAGFLAVFLAPWRLVSRPATDPPPSRAALWLLRWLLFRLMFSSAVVKLASGDPAWRHLTALEHHYETQPLPPWTAWYAHQLPAAFQRLSAAVMFAVEGVAPFFVLAPRRLRFAAAWTMIAFQTLILVTGNYGFFNLLTIALCVPLLDDGAWPWTWGRAARPAAARRGRWPAWLVRPAAAVLLVLGLEPLLGALHWPDAWLGPVPALYALASPFRTVNPYGLFAVMTTERPEIVVEGSDDGVTWRPYEFRWKPGDVRRRPGFVAPHDPRLDWQMWFAALGGPREAGWFFAFCRRLLEGSRPVLGLLAANPFPRAPPRYVAAFVYDYRFTDAATRRATGAWWRREPRGPYCPALTLEGGRLAAAPVAPPSR